MVDWFYVKNMGSGKRNRRRRRTDLKIGHYR